MNRIYAFCMYSIYCIFVHSFRRGLLFVSRQVRRDLNWADQAAA